MIYTVHNKREIYFDAAPFDCYIDGLGLWDTAIGGSLLTIASMLNTTVDKSEIILMKHGNLDMEFDDRIVGAWRKTAIALYTGQAWIGLYDGEQEITFDQFPRQHLGAATFHWPEPLASKIQSWIDG